ncbi:hypothetical protein [Mycolicibacterium baixiangningiae]|uniref:hypothetical protein n=1 Tax=Mycolicibacterium baixiangningiae TaxID=2761578 RepID=UPI001E54C625|nr:hypothetical protein [Mycolicibacterium baixiangningiae]
MVKRSNTKSLQTVGTRSANAPVAARIVGGVFRVNGREQKTLTGIDDHFLFVVAHRVAAPSGPAVCDAFLAAIARWGVPFEVLTDNGKRFHRQVHQAITGRGPLREDLPNKRHHRPID